jgi:hypothetical protein
MSKKLSKKEYKKNLIEPLKKGYDEMDISEWWDYMEKKSIEEYEKEIHELNDKARVKRSYE